MGKLTTELILKDNFSKKLNSINTSIQKTISLMNRVNSVTSTAGERSLSSLTKLTSEQLKYAQKQEVTLQKQITAQNKLDVIEAKRKLHAEQMAGKIELQNMALERQKAKQATLMGQLNAWATKLRTIATLYYGIRTAIQGIGKAVQLSDRMTMADARLGLMTDKDNSLKSLKTKTFAASMRSRTDYLDFTKAVTKMGILAGDKFKDKDSIIRFTELMNKQFQVGGAETSERNAAMLQLTQAIASNRLGGDELRTIRETAPLLVKYIQKSLNVGEQEFKELAKEGEITADVIIKAMAESSGELEKMFNKLPLTWEAVWTRFKNVGIMAFQPIQEQLKRLFNNQRFLKFMVGLQNALIALGNVGGWVLKTLFDLVGNICDVFERFPKLLSAITTGLLIMGIMGIAHLAKMLVMTIYNTFAQMLYNIQLAFTLTNILRMQMGLQALTFAQWAANVAMGVFQALLGSVWFWIILIIAVVYGVVAAINHFCGTSISATGVIAGCFAWLGALIANIFIFIGNVGSAVVQGVVNAWNWCANNVGAIFDNIGIWWNNLWIDAKIGFYSFINDVLSKLSSLAQKIQPIAKLLDIDLSGMIGDAQASVTGKITNLGSKKKSYKSLQAWTPVDWTTWEYKSLSGAYKKGYNWGSNLKSNIAEGWDKLTKLDLDMSKAQLDALNGIKNGVGDMSDGLGDVAGNTGDTAKNTGDTAKNTASAYEQDYSYLRNWAYQSGMGSSIGYNIKIEQNNKNNIGSNMDLNRVVDAVRDAIIEGIYTQAEKI